MTILFWFIMCVIAYVLFSLAKEDWDYKQWLKKKNEK